MLDCGDSLCIFAINKRGQRTNGGCRCLPRNEVSKEMRRKITEHMYEINKMRKTTVSKEVAERLKEDIDGSWFGGSISVLKQIHKIIDEFTEGNNENTKT